MARRLACVFGGSGFIGRHVVRRLAADGWRVRAAVRDPVAAAFLKPMGDVEQVVPVAASVTDDAAVKAVVHGADTVVYLVGILYERGAATFQAIHVDGARRAALAAKAAGAKSFVYVSALGADKDSASAYARSKAEGEAAVLAAFPEAVILRPSVVFGPDDNFFNRFAAMTGFSPALPVYLNDGFKPVCGASLDQCRLDVWGSGGPKFQPVYVGDVATAVMAGINDPALHGQTFELGGPRTYSLKQIMELVLKETGRKRWLLPLPMSFGAIHAAVLQLWPWPLLTTDQVKLMRRDNVLDGGKPGLKDLGVDPTAAEAILPQYLHRFLPGHGVKRPQSNHNNSPV